MASLVLATSVCLALGGAVSGCKDSATPRTLSFELLTQSGLGPPSSLPSGTESVGYRVFDDTDSWTGFWSRAFTDAAPTVNFEREFVLCVYQGTKSTGGYAIAVEDVQLVQGTLRVVLDLKEPRPGDMLIQVITDPFAMYKVTIPPGSPQDIQATDLQMRFVQRQESGEISVRAQKLGSN